MVMMRMDWVLMILLILKLPTTRSSCLVSESTHYIPLYMHKRELGGHTIPHPVHARDTLYPTLYMHERELGGHTIPHPIQKWWCVWMPVIVSSSRESCISLRVK